jgi:hypothetical protein
MNDATWNQINEKLNEEDKILSGLIKSQKKDIK